MDTAYRDFAPSFATVKFWVPNLTNERSRRPKTAFGSNNIKNVHKIVLHNH